MERRECEQYVRQVRRDVVGRIEARISDLEGRIAQVMNGPVEIPRAGSAMVDAWDRIGEELGSFAHNFTVRGERLFVKSRRAGAVGGLGTAAEATGILVDTLDAFLDRYDPGSANVNAALEVFCADMGTVAKLRRLRGSIMRDGVGNPAAVAESELERAALTGSFEQAVQQVEAIHLDLEGDRSSIVDMVDPVGIKEIGDRLHVKRRTVDQWLQRGLMPAPRWVVGGRPAWNWPDIREWALETGRDKPEAVETF